jgi:hypothetical protein
MHRTNYIMLLTDPVHMVQIIVNGLWFVMEIDEKEVDEVR